MSVSRLCLWLNVVTHRSECLPRRCLRVFLGTHVSPLLGSPGMTGQVTVTHREVPAWEPFQPPTSTQNNPKPCCSLGSHGALLHGQQGKNSQVTEARIASWSSV